MTKAIIFDLNGVFLQSPKLSERFEQKYGVDKDTFFDALRDIANKVNISGEVPAYTYWKPYLEAWNLDIPEEEFFDFWFSAEYEVPEMLTLAKNLKDQGTKIFILTNNFKERTDFYDAHFPFLHELFDGTYYSWKTGFRKPQPEAYQQILNQHGLKPEECVFFDDAEKNLEGARSIGIHALLAENYEGIIKDVNAGLD